VVHRGDYCITQNTYTPEANVEVTFRVSGYTLPPEYIAVGCNVVAVEKYCVYLQNDIMYGIIPLEGKNSFLRPGMIVPVRVTNSRYNDVKITTEVRVFTHNEPWSVYSIIAGAEIDYSELTARAEKLRDEIADSKYEVAKLMAVPVKTVPALPLVPFGALEGVVCLSPKIELGAVKAPTTGANGMRTRVIYCSKYEAAARILTDYIMYAGLIKFIGDTYSSKEKVAEHKAFIIAVNNSKSAAF
jgi:hypothetical protein